MPVYCICDRVVADQVNKEFLATTTELFPKIGGCQLQG
jgi:hypothetical protein